MSKQMRLVLIAIAIAVAAYTGYELIRYFFMRVNKGDLENGNVKAFLKVIRYAEGTADANGYRKKFGGNLFDVSAGWFHPNDCVPFKNTCSTAAGAYQFLFRTWEAKRKQLSLTDFSPENQDWAALQLIADKGALEDVKAGRFEVAINKVRKVWASLPGAGYNQPEKSIASLINRYKAEGGNIA